ncbi:histamine H2 receptor-like [Exaiptasia diaphana]|uniref:G-protein coupled receptors family 1 profile domain-containing protein n=1 Tax=Exaiptasia diaphana TaxID=2652724 RepID=A0A913WQU5_EXADI|nr:histamine H2 receptor-like [Exaiptasia diaphana]
MEPNETSISRCSTITTYFLHFSRNFSYDRYLLSVFAVNCFICLIASFSNFVIILTILKTKSLQTAPNILLLGLAVSDFFVGIITIPFFLIYKFSEYNRDVSSYCFSGIVYVYSAAILATISFLNLTAVTADRFFAIQLHLRYKQLITSKLYTKLLLLIWFTCITGVVMRMYLANNFYYLLVACVIFVMMLVLNAVFIFKVAKTIRRHKTQIRTHATPGTLNMPKYRKTVSTMYYIIGAFVVCYFTFASALILVTCDRSFSFRNRALFTVGETFLLSNSALNPVIYCWRIKEIRTTSLKLLKNIVKKREMIE